MIMVEEQEVQHLVRDNAHLPPTWPGFNFDSNQALYGVEFVVGSCPALTVFQKFNSVRKTTCMKPS